MPDSVLVRLASLWRSRRVGFILAGLLLIVGTPFLGYYVMSYYSVSGVSVQIVSGTRTLGSPIEYRLDIRVSSPGAVMLVRLWRPSMTLTLDSYNLAGVSPYTPAYSSGDWNHLNPGDSLTYRGLWRSSNALDPSAEQTLSQIGRAHV